MKGNSVMKKRSKGFSIPELLAVIVIMGILITIASFTYNGISKSMKKRAYDNKLNLIKTKSVEYATDNNINNETISVAKLVMEGYLDIENDTDKNEKVSNPLGGYLDCYEINIKREIDDYDVDVDAGSSCDIANLDVAAAKIKIYAYEYEEKNGTDDINLNDIGNNKNVKWTNKNLYLFIDPDTLPDKTNVKITWGLSSDTKEGNLAGNVTANESYANIYKVKTYSVYNTNMVVQIEANKRQYRQTVSVKIDKEIPTLTMDANAAYETLDENTKRATKVINFNGSDGSGSGVGYTKTDGKAVGYFLTNDSNYTPNKSDFDIEVSSHAKAVYENGTYYGYAIDAAGNISKASTISITNAEYNLPVCMLPKANTTWTNRDYTYTYGCQDNKGTGCATSPISKTVSNDTQTIDGFSWNISDNVGNAVACKVDTLTVKVDKTAPTCEIVVDSSSARGQNGWYIGDVKLNLKTNDNLSGVSEYGITTSSNAEYNNQKQAILNHDTDRNGVTYYGYVKDNAGNTNTCKLTVKRLTQTPSCSIQVTSGTKGPSHNECKWQANDNNNNNNNNSFVGGAFGNLFGNLFGNNWGSSGSYVCHEVENEWYLTDVTAEITSNSQYVVSKTINDKPNNYTVNWSTAGETLTGKVTNEAGLTGSCSGPTIKRETADALDYKTTVHSGETYGCGILWLNKCTTTTFGMEITKYPPSGVASKAQSWDGESYDLSDSVSFELEAKSSKTIYQRVCTNAGNCVYHGATTKSNACGAAENLAVKAGVGIIGGGFAIALLGPVVGGIAAILGIIFASC